jgi:ribosomal-protein-alanine N-acetyltransferase
MKNFPIIQTEHLVLCQFTAKDLENVFYGLSHPDVIKYYGVSFNTLEATKVQMEWFKNLEETETGIWWAIWSKDKKQFYGAGGLNDMDKTKAEIGFWLLPEFWGKGIMNEAMPLICNYAFTRLGLERIEGFVDPENSNCKSGLAKLNFEYKRTDPDCEMRDEKKISLDVYVMASPLERGLRDV